jgi:DNA-binding NtrC family response regulator
VLAKLPLADGGTLYLEGIQHLPHDRQRTLADLLGEMDSARGASLALQPDVRIIVSTSRTVDEEIAAGRLLPELRRRLHTIDLAPLRERADDLPALADHILKRQAEQAGRLVPPLSADSLKRLQAYRWPGNFRELRSVLECAVATSTRPELDVSEHLLDDSVRSAATGCSSASDPAAWARSGWRDQLLARPRRSSCPRPVRDDEEALAFRQRFERRRTRRRNCSRRIPCSCDFGVTDTGSFYYVMSGCAAWICSAW